VASEIHTNSGDHRAALTDIDRAQRLIHADSVTTRPDWFDFYDSARLVGFEGYARLQAGSSDRAVTLLDDALLGIGRDATKQRAIFLVDLATACVGTGDVDRACAVALEATESLKARPYKTCEARLRTFRSSLRPYSGSRVVRDLDCAMVER
jgi:hypothetical protein